MKRNRFLLILVAIAMSMLLVQGALAADGLSSGAGSEGAAEGSQLDELLASIEADRSAVVDDLVDSLATDDATAEQLRATLDRLSALTLAEIVQNATSLEDVESMLSETIFRLGDTNRDFAYTPVTPCRIIDTRIAGGAFVPGARREFNVYGNTIGQGGTICNSPNGEPRAVHLYIVSVPVAGQGNFGAYPANIPPPFASVLNYRTGVQNIGNAATIQTFFSFFSREIEFINRFGTSHLIVDVLGYYHNTENLAGAEFAGGDQSIALGPAATTVRSIVVSAPASGRVIVNASGYMQMAGPGTVDFGRCSITTGTVLDFNFLIPVAERAAGAMFTVPFGATRGFNVGPGNTTFRLVCDEFSGDVRLDDSSLTGTWVPRNY